MDEITLILRNNNNFLNLTTFFGALNTNIEL